MKKALLLTIFGCLAAVASMEAVGVQVDIGPGLTTYGYADCEDCYDYGYWNDGVVWVGPGWYYGYWFADQPAFWAWRRNYYWRGHGHGWHHGGGHHGGHHGGGHHGGGHHGGGHHGGGHHGGGHHGGGHHGGGHHGGGHHGGGGHHR